MAFDATTHGIGPRYFFEAARDFVLPEDFLSGVAKAAGFGAIISLLACFHGARTTGGADGVGRATTQTVVHGALAVIVLDYVLSRILLPLLARGPGF